MPPKPTCKVVKREGQRGARIDPKGCKVRTTKDAQGNKRQYNKQGQEKFKMTEIKDEHAMIIAIRSRQYATVVSKSLLTEEARELHRQPALSILPTFHNKQPADKQPGPLILHDTSQYSIWGSYIYP